MLGFPNSSSGTNNNGTKRNICRCIFSMAKENPGTKNVGGVQIVLEIYVSITQRHQQVDIRECGIWSKFGNGIKNTWQKLDAAIENLVAIMSSYKSQVETLLTKNAQLAKQIYEKDATITQLTNEMSNLVNIITKIASKNMVNNSSNNKAEKLSFNRSRAKNPDDTPYNQNGYCWTHGNCVHFNHSSANWK